MRTGRTVEQPAEPARSRRRDGGYTLVENLVSIVLLGLIASSILAGMWTVVRVSTFSDDQSKVVSVLASAADRVANFAYVPCPETVDGGGAVTNEYQSIAKGAADAVDWPTTTVTVTAMHYWRPGTGWSTENGLAGGACNQSSGFTESTAMQKVTVTVSSDSGKYTRSLEVVKSPVRADYNPANDPDNT